MTIHHLRRDYRYGSLQLDQMPSDPMPFFQTWFEELRTMEMPEWFEPNAMSLSTHKLDGGTACRIVLLKIVDADGFVFFTNYESDKGCEISANPKVALDFYWPIMDRQVRVEGIAERTDDSLSEQYFHSRPRSSQLSAYVSPQSKVIESESHLEELVTQLDAKLAGAEVPRPDYWGGYRVRPSAIEFWQGRPSRLHDRFRYDRSLSGVWTVHRLGP